MVTEVLNTAIQDFINSNLNADISSLILRGLPFKTIDSKLIIEQIEAKKRCQKKLPTWFGMTNIYYPNKLNIEQTSSEVTAKYKAKLICGMSLIDLTGGFGVDTYYFSKNIQSVLHCEVNAKLSNITKHNFKVLGTKNIKCINANGINTLKTLEKTFDWIYIDPSRRDTHKQKVFFLEDCKPNVITYQGLFLKYAKNVMLKTSPLLDISTTLKDLNFVKHIHIVALNNEVKEVLWILEQDYSNTIKVHTINIGNLTNQNFDFDLSYDSNITPKYNLPKQFLYEPNAAILKAGAFNLISDKFHIEKLHKHSHLYTSEIRIPFPGRCFKIIHQLPFNKKLFSKMNIKKANVTIRNFPISVFDIRKKLNLKEGGDTYLFFTTNIKDEKIILVCKKD